LLPLARRALGLACADQITQLLRQSHSNKSNPAFF
jgi:hypothetical protein